MSLLIPEGDSLVTYYLLPLVGVNKNTFGRSFKQSYVDKEGLKIFVELRSNMITPSYKSNPNYISEMILNRKMFVLFSLPARFIASGKNFVQGKYSGMSKDAKKLIYSSSGLPYNKTNGSFVMSHPILQALDTTKTLRSFLLNHLKVKKVADSNELIDLPESWWFIETRINE